MLTSHATLRLSLLAVLLASACTAEDHSAQDARDEEPSTHDEGAVASSFESLNLIAQVEFDNQGTLSFYEPEPGMLVEIETGPLDPPRAKTEGEDSMTSAEKYEAISGEPAPARLIELVEETRAARALIAEPNAPEKKEKANNTFEFMTPQEEFRARFCRPTDRYYEKLNWNNPTRHKAENANYYRFGIHAGAGTVRYEWLFKGNWVRGSLQAGWATAATMYHDYRGRDVETKVTPVPFDARFDHCVNFHY